MIEAGASRDSTKVVCADAGLTILMDVYARMGRFDCFWCPNQRPAQAVKVAQHYPALAAEWEAAEARKGHSFLSLPLHVLVANDARERHENPTLFECSCFGGTDDVFALEDDEVD